MRLPVGLALLSVFVVVAISIAIVIVLRPRKSPADRELLRRMAVHRLGRIGDGFITEASDRIIYYSYSIGGVEYAASQDISTLRHRIPVDPETLIGPVGLKFMPRNPFDSIVLCEEWSGIRKQQSTLFQKGA